MKAAFFAYQARQRGENASFSEEELSSCMKNEAPGAPELSIMSFETAFHGRLFGSLSLTRSKAIHKVHYICRPFVKTADCVMSARCSSICKSGRYRSQLNSDFVPEMASSCVAGRQVSFRRKRRAQRSSRERRARQCGSNDRGVRQDATGRCSHRRAHPSGRWR